MATRVCSRISTIGSLRPREQHDDQHRRFHGRGRWADFALVSRSVGTDRQALLYRRHPVEARLDKTGFYPAGDGRIEVSVTPCHRLERLRLLERGEHRSTKAAVLVANLPEAVAAKEVEYLSRDLEVDASSIEVIDIKGSPGPGNVILVRVESDSHTEVFTGFGQKGVPASRVVGELANRVKGYLKNAAPVGVHLADQLIVPAAMAGKGSFRTVGVTAHTSTNVNVVMRFLDVSIDIQREERGNVLVGVAAR
ncbi:MAG: RNA 3'-terminal phosphate cyclase [Myxococcota bacterium]